MEFISPKTDFAFKRIFGSQESKDILISFLNALIYAGNPTIQDLDIIDPYNQGESSGLKDSYLDVKAVLGNGTTVLIEMQVLNVPAFKKRVLYNWAKTYGNQLSMGKPYVGLQPVIALTIADFPLFPKAKPIITHFCLKEKSLSFEYPDEQIELIFVELRKFHKSLEELETLTEKWIYFMKEAPNLQMIPSSLEEVPEIGKALGIANRANLSPKEAEELERKERWILDQEGYVTQARIDGLEQGLEQGREEGRAEAALGLILRLLERRFGEVPEATLAQIQQLSLEDLDELGIMILDWRSVEDLGRWLRERG
ncbi:Rpn family recombination-promoting nuclease/putative transposase, partial [Roseofilum sp. BLCC_M154]